jgi:replication fork protection complex subunit Csm3/Swi3
LRFKCKGHEYSDAARILSLYQLWLDDLYPKAKFTDALAIVEKLGHSKHMQIMRKGWIEGNTSRTIDSIRGDANPRKAEQHMSIDENGENAGTTTEITTQESLFGKGLQANRTPPETSDLGDSEDLYGSPKVKRAAKSTPKPNGGGSGGLFISDDEAHGHNAAEGIVKDVVNGEDDVPEENELDALLDEDATNAVSNDAVIKGGKALNITVMPFKTRTEDEFDDEMEAMIGMDNM